MLLASHERDVNGSVQAEKKTACVAPSPPRNKENSQQKSCRKTEDSLSSIIIMGHSPAQFRGSNIKFGGGDQSIY